MDEAVRLCGTCGETKPLSEFYKDGKDKEGNVKYRRDCKECYRITRLRARQMKDYIMERRSIHSRQP